MNIEGCPGHPTEVAPHVLHPFTPCGCCSRVCREVECNAEWLIVQEALTMGQDV